MEIISPFSLNSSLHLDLNSDREFAVSISAPSSASDGLSASSSTYSTFTPTSGRSTPQKCHTLDSSYLSCPQEAFFDMNPLQPYAAGSLSPEYKPNMTRVDYLGTYVPEGFPARQSVESIPTTMGYSDYVEMSVPQTYSTSAPVEPPTYGIYPMAERYRARPLDSPMAANTVCLPDMCNSEPYDLGGAIISRPPFSSMAAFSAGDHFKGSDTESVGSHSVLSPIDAISSPELPQRIAMVNISDRPGGQKPARDASAGRRGSMDQALPSPSESDDKGHLRPFEIKRVSSGQHACTVAGCNKSFNRKEHLKRHEKATHEKVEIRCKFCQEKKDKPFNRWDNYKHHVKMHASKRNAGRVEFHPDAPAEYAMLVRGTKPRNQRRGVPAGRRSGVHRPRRDPSGSFPDLHDTT